MKWMEMIRVRTTAEKVKEIKRQLLEQRLPLLATKGLAGAYVLDNVEYAGDVAVVLVWESSHPPAKSREGLLLAEVGLKHGPVDHGLWTLSNELESTSGETAAGGVPHVQ